jgi:hypothetical protein
MLSAPAGVSCPSQIRSLRAASAGLRRWGLVTAALLLVTTSFGAASAFGAVIADWEMNEAPGATTMHDSSGSGLNGTIGSAVVTGDVTDGATGYRWLSANRWNTAHPERLIKVTSSKLNPGTENFTVIMRFNTGSFGDQNIIQKGQAKTSGGMWKIPLFDGKIGCNFLGVAHRSAVGRGRSSRTTSGTPFAAIAEPPALRSPSTAVRPRRTGHGRGASRTAGRSPSVASRSAMEGSPSGATTSSAVSTASW